MQHFKKLKIYLSVDAEPRIGQSIDKFPNVKPQGLEALYGLEYIDNTLRKYNAIGLLFIETLHHHYFSDALMKYMSRFLNNELFEIGLHIHPAWTFFSTKQKISDNCAELSVSQLENCIDDGIEQLKKFTSNRNIRFFRSGNLSAGKNLFDVLTRRGFTHISTSSMGYSHATENYHAPYYINKTLLDVPVTTFYRKSLKNQILSITGVSTFENKLILNQAYKKNLDFVMVITHPFEFIDKNNRMIRGNCQRLDALCSFVKENQEKFEFCNDLSLLKPCQDTILTSSFFASVNSMILSKINEYY